MPQLVRETLSGGEVIIARDNKPLVKLVPLSGGRRTPGNDIMQVISAKLTEDEMRALASYTQGLH